jgi:hypothetical protein
MTDAMREQQRQQDEAQAATDPKREPACSGAPPQADD